MIRQILVFLLCCYSLAELPAQSLNEIACRPADSSCGISIMTDNACDLYCEYGTTSGVYTASTPVTAASPDAPVLITLSSLRPDTRYFYRTRYRLSGSAVPFSAGKEHAVRTQRAPGASFRFVVEADPHPYDKKGSHTLWKRTLQNQLADSADFLLDLGDTFGDDHTALTITSEEVRRLHRNGRDNFGTVCHSLPLLFCLGNHEGESGYYLQLTPPQNLGVYGTLWRKFYFPNPVPGNFYSGNTAVEAHGIGVPENYYAWQWGDALFVVLDVYRYASSAASPGTWDWTLGSEQYEWFRRTLQQSNAKFKFVFAHHVRGWGRGAALLAKYFEWGGYENNGTTYGFTARRPGWELPIHQLMKRYGVSVFFQGHDHLFAKETYDGVIYQEVPMPSDSTYIIGVTDNAYAYSELTMNGSGYLRVSVTPGAATVDYVRSWLPADETEVRKNGEIAFSYTVTPGVAAAEASPLLPQVAQLEQNVPNPFNPSTLIRFRVAQQGHVMLTVHDVVGRQVSLLVDEQRTPGWYTENFSGVSLPAGVYFYRLTTAAGTLVRKAVLLK